MEKYLKYNEAQLNQVLDEIKKRLAVAGSIELQGLFEETFIVGAAIKKVREANLQKAV